MKRKFIVIISILFIMPFILIVKSMAAESNYTQEQKALREVADAYYQRGINAQYCSWRKSAIYSPEGGTTQNTIYSVCSNFTLSTYYQALGMKVQGGYASTHKIQAYAYKYYDPDNITTNDVIEFWNMTKDENDVRVYKDNKGNVKNIDLTTPTGRRQYADKLLREYNLQVGDIICYHTGIEGSNEGHALLVYDIIYNESGEPVDAVIRESTSHYEKNTTKITKGLSYADILNENNDVHEGTFKELYLSNIYNTSSTVSRNAMIYKIRNIRYFTIIRPLLKDENGNYTGKYYYSSFKSQSDAIPAGYVCTGRTLQEYTITDSALKRLDYSKIYIEKTVDKFNNSVVSLGDELEYTIKVKNNSDKKYNSFEIMENIPQYVEIINNGNGTIKNSKIKWNIPELRSKQSIEIKYKVKVKNNVSYLGKEIISTGTVAGIPSSTVKNVISCNLNNDKRATIIQKVQSLTNSKTYHGQELISKIYKQSTGIELNLNELDITDLIKTNGYPTYYPAEGGTKEPAIYLNKENKFYNMILNNYYGALHTDKNGNVLLKGWKNYDYWDSRDSRVDTIYEGNFQTGDILVYKNTQDSEGKENVTYKTEDGTYYLIYIDEKDKITVNNEEIYGFVGINDNGEVNHIGTDRTSLQTLLGKDYYVVLRPSMELDIVPMNLSVSYSNTKYTNGGVKVTITANEEMLPVSGWTLSENKKKLTKTFTKNIEKNYSIYDLGGNKTTVGIKISNIIEKMGDINKDSKINISDVIAVIRHIGAKEGSKYYLNEEKRAIADINQDGKINIADVIGIIRLISTSK